MKNDIYNQAFKQFCLFCLWVALARFSKGLVLPVMALLGVMWAFKGEAGKSFSIYSMLLCMVTLNPNILPKVGFMYSLGLRFGPLIIGLALAMKGAMASKRQALPMGMMLLFLLVALLSSINGWYPQVSYLKLVNFLVFFLGIWLGTKGLQRNEREVKILRATLLALAIFLILGSAVLWPFPGISTLNALVLSGEVEDVATRNAIIMEMIDSGGTTLFCGVTGQSQMLSPLLACSFAWVLCDMLFVEGRFRWQHAALLLCALPLLYLTRSRTALVGVMVALALIYFYLPQRLTLDKRMKIWLGHILIVGGVALVALAAVAEIRSHTISRWIRKTDDIKSDQRSLSEAFTASRQGLVDMCMDDFKRSPMLGMGFQVSVFTPQLMEGQKGLILSSPIEKGVAPIMILGETGVVGSLVFIAFLVVFYFGCESKSLFISVTMMLVLLALNMGEATFFSPGGIGGPQWMFCIVGGYTLDLMLDFQRKGRGVWR